ncbi:MAG: site-2 protease family protein [Acidobacteria bacterium]|nr:site-2 protease family protein [Acidobacteriota bacterium]
MGIPSSDYPETVLQASEPPDDDLRDIRSRPRPQRVLRHVLLLALTVVTTTIAGSTYYASFVSDLQPGPLDLTSLELYANGLWYSLSVLAILGAHEFGHYYACRHYGVDASLPYFLPAPLPLTGTFGAFIRIRGIIPGKRELFDIGIAGPIAGFVVAVPVLFIGMALSRLVPDPVSEAGFIEFGEPLLFQWATWLFWGTPADGFIVNMHPMVFAAWFGLLATALNLFPIGQLDGGHISYAVLGRRSTLVTLGTVGVLVGLTFVSSSWVVWTVLTIGMLFGFGMRHPRTYDEDAPLDRWRLWLAGFALVMFILSFTPAPVEISDAVSSPAPPATGEPVGDTIGI